MEQLYNIVVAKPNFPFEYLTYESKTELSIGTIVKIEIKNSKQYGMVISKSELSKSQIKNLKMIDSVLPFCISSIQLEFLKKISFLTFNSVANLLTITLKPIETIFESKKFGELNLLSTAIIKKVKTSKPNIEYIIDINWTDKIISRINNIQSGNVLILFPEKNILTSIHDQLLHSKLNENIKIHNLNTTSEKKLLNIYLPLLSLEPNGMSVNVILGNKNSIFYDLSNIEELIIIDEANPSYIAEHRIYFDAREVAFWGSNIYNFDLTFISTLPSVRFLELSKIKLESLTIPKVKIKFLERQGRQNDFENILLELENDGDLIVDEY